MCDNFIPDFRYSTLTPISQTAISLFFVDSWILLIPITASNIIAGGAAAGAEHRVTFSPYNSTQLSIASPTTEKEEEENNTSTEGRAGANNIHRGLTILCYGGGG